jgi:DNA-binding PadR family transcriptional regulator
MSTVRLLVLGSIFRRGTSHGYAVYSDITSWHAETWTNVKPGSIYHALNKLESQGMTKKNNSDDNVKLGPSRTEYTITKKGESEFIALLESALTSADIQQFAVGIAFMDILSREKVTSLLKRRHNELEESANFLRNLPTDEFSRDPSKHPELVGTWVSYVENEAATAEKILKNIQAGMYIFKSEITKEDNTNDKC